MPTQSFVQAKKIGRWFEALTRSTLAERGFEVIDSEKLKYKDKRGWDCEVRINNERCKMKIKYDFMSETTGNVCLELSTIRQSQSPIWIYGLPQNAQIDLYTMYLSDLATYVDSWPIKRPVGEFQLPAALIPKHIFISQSFVKKFKTIQLSAR
jgi:hypothetical protein